MKISSSSWRSVSGASLSAGRRDGGTVRPPRRGHWALLAVLAVCAAPVVASYVAYYAVRPSARANYGELVEPQRDLVDRPLSTLDGSRFDWSSLRGRWILVTVDDGACMQGCSERLYAMRQVRLTTGKDRDRIERVWLVSDDATPPPDLLAEHEGLHAVRAARRPLDESFPAAEKGRVFVVDPLGHLMMRFPPQAEPDRMKRDITRLLRASRVG